MTSTAPRYPVKAKSLTLLELCNTINDLRYTSSRDAAPILTRRLYLHPLKTSPNAKQQSSKIISNKSPKVDPHGQGNLAKPTSFRNKMPYRGLTILSPSLSFTSHSTTRFNTSIISDNDDSNEYDTSTTTSSLNQFNLPTINRNTSLSNKRSVFTRSLYIPNKRNMNSNHKISREKVNVWHDLDYILERPMPKDPPTTPLDILSDFHLPNFQEPEPQLQQQSDYNSIQDIKIYKQDSVYEFNY